MRPIKVRDGILGQIIIFALVCVNQIHVETFANNELLSNILWWIRLFNRYIFIPMEWIGKLSIEITQSYVGGFLGLILAILIVGFIYGIIIGAIIRLFAKLIRAQDKPKSSP
jgi:hypothetical protein